MKVGTSWFEAWSGEMWSENRGRWLEGVGS